MTILSGADWRAVEHAYLHSTETLAAIAARYNVTVATINNRRVAKGWLPRRAKAIKNHEVDQAGKAAMKAALVARFFRLIHLKLEQLEEDMARSTERTPADNERETRALGTLIRNTEKVFGLEQETGNDGKPGERDRAAPETQAETDAIRRELAQRLASLRQSEPGDES